jgi:hypothetical protein
MIAAGPCPREGDAVRFPACALLVLAAVLPARAAAATPDVRNVFDPDHVGAWTLTTEFSAAAQRDFGATPQQTSALSARLATLAEVIHGAPVFNPLRGFEARVLARFHPFDAWWSASTTCGPGDASCQRVPLMAELVVTLFDFFHLSNAVPPKIMTFVEINSDALFHINVQELALPRAATIVDRLPDRRPVSLKPIEVGRVAGFPIYKSSPGDNEAHLIFTNGRPVWVPVTREQFITTVIRAREQDVEKQRAEVEKLKKAEKERIAGKEQRVRELEKTYEQIEKDPVKRQTMLQDALKAAALADETMAKSMAQLDGKVGEMKHLLLDAPRAELQRMSPEERVSTAWYRGAGDASSGLVPAGTPGAREVVTLNLDYFDTMRPRSDIQLIAVTLNSQNETRSGPDAVTSAIRLDEFRDGADWARIASFVESAR